MPTILAERSSHRIYPPALRTCPFCGSIVGFVILGDPFADGTYPAGIARLLNSHPVQHSRSFPGFFAAKPVFLYFKQLRDTLTCRSVTGNILKHICSARPQRMNHFVQDRADNNSITTMTALPSPDTQCHAAAILLNHIERTIAAISNRTTLTHIERLNVTLQLSPIPRSIFIRITPIIKMTAGLSLRSDFNIFRQYFGTLPADFYTFTSGVSLFSDSSISHSIISMPC